MIYIYNHRQYTRRCWTNWELKLTLLHVFDIPLVPDLVYHLVAYIHCSYMEDDHMDLWMVSILMLHVQLYAAVIVSNVLG